MSLLDVGIFSNDLLLNGLDILVSNIGHMIIRGGHNRRIEWVEKLDRMEWEKHKIVGGREVGEVRYERGKDRKLMEILLHSWFIKKSSVVNRQLVYVLMYLYLCI